MNTTAAENTATSANASANKTENIPKASTRSETEQLIESTEAVILRLESALRQLAEAANSTSKAIDPSTFGDPHTPPPAPADGIILLHWVDDRFHNLFCQMQAHVHAFRTQLAQQILNTQTLMRHAQEKVDSRLQQLRRDLDAVRSLPPNVLSARAPKDGGNAYEPGSVTTLTRADRSRLRRLTLKLQRTTVRATTTLDHLPPLPSHPAKIPANKSGVYLNQFLEKVTGSKLNQQIIGGVEVTELPWLEEARQAAKHNTELLERILKEWKPFPSDSAVGIIGDMVYDEEDTQAESEEDQNSETGSTYTSQRPPSIIRSVSSRIFGDDSDTDDDSDREDGESANDKELADLQRSRSLFQVDWLYSDWVWDASRLGNGVVLGTDRCRAENTSWFGTGHSYGSVGLTSGRHAFDIKINAVGNYLAVGLFPHLIGGPRDSYLHAFCWLSDGAQYDAQGHYSSLGKTLFEVGDVITIEFHIHPTNGWVALHNPNPNAPVFVRQRLQPQSQSQSQSQSANDSDETASVVSHASRTSAHSARSVRIPSKGELGCYFPYIELGSGASVVLLCRRMADPSDENAFYPPEDW